MEAAESFEKPREVLVRVKSRDSKQVLAPASRSQATPLTDSNELQIHPMGNNDDLIRSKGIKASKILGRCFGYRNQTSGPRRGDPEKQIPER